MNSNDTDMVGEARKSDLAHSMEIALVTLLPE